MRCDGDVVKAGERRILLTVGAIVAIVIAVLNGAMVYGIASASATPAVRSAQASPQVVGSLRIVVFGANWCGSCRAAKAWLTEAGYAYEWHDVDDPATGRLLEAEAKLKPGRTTIPVIGVDGDYSQGFSAPSLQRRIHEAEERRAHKNPDP